MKIEHLAIWVKDLEKMRQFYETYFKGKAGELYHNPKKSFHSYFLSFSEGGCRLELMNMPSVPDSKADVMQQFTGFIHFAISVGSPGTVDELTEQLRKDGFSIIGEPRWTGADHRKTTL